MGRRDTSDQSTPRNALVKALIVAHQLDQAMWCPALSEWVLEVYSIAAHLFSRKQAMTDAIFKREKEKEPEPFSSKNAFIMDARAEKMFDKGFSTIVPLVPNEPSRTKLFNELF